MIKYFLLLIALLPVLGSCNQDQSANSEMSEELLIAILEDVHVASTIVKKYPLVQRDSVSQILRTQIAEIHQFTVEDIDFAMEQLQLSPAKYLALEKKAVENLKTLKDSLKLVGAVVPEK